MQAMVFALVLAIVLLLGCASSSAPPVNGGDVNVENPPDPDTRSTDTNQGEINITNSEMLDGNNGLEVTTRTVAYFGSTNGFLAVPRDEGTVDATLIYYGNLVTDEERLSRINWPVLGIFGDQDTSIPVESVNGFKTALDELGIENEVYIYEGVEHAFANPSGQNYAPEQTIDAWGKTLVFLEKHLKTA
ncbi:MAG: dienelactone hydrolase family protein [Candidatus Diapherotrites archaeon]|nr:dienelactone hydrolase family protein [Candidatus Diapherotrites archaeon]